MSAMFKANQTSFRKGCVPWNAGKKLSKKYREKLSLARLQSPFRTGELHPRWKGGKRGYYADQAKMLLEKNNVEKKCFICNTKNNVHVHHKDKNWKNNTLKNLTYLCISCHLILHHKQDKNRNICRWCGKVFISGRRKSAFCSSSCRSKNWKAEYLQKYERR